MINKGKRNKWKRGRGKWWDSRRGEEQKEGRRCDRRDWMGQGWSCWPKPWHIWDLGQKPLSLGDQEGKLNTSEGTFSLIFGLHIFLKNRRIFCYIIWLSHLLLFSVENLSPSFYISSFWTTQRHINSWHLVSVQRAFTNIILFGISVL